MRRTKRGGWPYSQPPNVPFEINRDSPQSVGLVAWWPTLASQGVADILRDLVGGNHGTLIGGPRWVISGGQGAVLDYDGTGEYIDTGTSLLGNGISQITLAVWFKSDASNQNAGLLYTGSFAGAHGEVALYLYNSHLYGRTNLVNENSVAFTDTSSWHHAALVFDSTLASDNGKIYLDGIFTGIDYNDAVAVDLSGLKTVIGAYYSSSYDLNGRIGDARIYSRALTAAEVWQLYAEPWELYKPLIRRWIGWKSPITARIPRYGFTNFQVPGIV